MFNRVLVANRGEIALRVMRACRELGFWTVAVYSEADRDSLHVHYADEAFLIGPPPAVDSYLRIDTIIAVARQAHVDAIHPGYGFLAENAAFARACVAAGIVFIGPSATAMERMGSKIAARREATHANVPLVPGTTAPVTSAEAARLLGEQFGYPIALKAASGGGGRGLKVAHAPGEVEEAFQSSRREAAAYFKDDTVYVEKYLMNPRHIEIQILADQHGTVLALGERDCSVQRRHQKLLEEAPSPVMTPEVRTSMQAAAVRLCEQVGYVGAGTLEFLWSDGQFYFLEMNTRIQVEHTVTEAITGLDLVKWQLRIAQGEPLPYTQHDIVLRGHAIECRINAEDPAANFAPSLGTLASYAEPHGLGVRVDTGFKAGSTIPQFYDSLIAKLITWGSDRPEALARMVRALSDFEISGVKTTIPFHQLLLRNPAFVRGEATVRFIEDHIGEAGLHALATPPIMGDDFDEFNGARRFAVEVNGKRFTVRVAVPEDLLANDAVQRQPASYVPHAAKRSKAPTAPGTLVAPLQGTVVTIRVAPGDMLQVGQVVAVVEAMKMENEVVATHAGRVKAVLVQPGQSVQAGMSLVTLEV
ncbi:MAG: acetyl-CoA carboxylase biotin carboxylase subunit [Herpetosiphonaceae bacterium]|nr:acetyl-CoA carboxylase biotin carboxylase subunit [Herpetosiphonaceae bacterium]